MEKKVDLLKQKKIRITPQRLGILDVLEKTNEHLTAEELYDRMKPKFPAISLATVYSVLELYKKNGIVVEIRIMLDRACFEMRLDHHHHFYCKSCGKIIDIDLHPCPALKKEEVEGHTIEELHGYFYGVCRDCKKKDTI